MGALPHDWKSWPLVRSYMREDPDDIELLYRIEVRQSPHDPGFRVQARIPVKAGIAPKDHDHGQGTSHQQEARIPRQGVASRRT